MVILFFTTCCSRYKPLEVVPKVNLERYSGTWFEIARFPNFFEKGLDCVSATYTLRKDGRIDVLNQGRMTGDPSEIKSANGIAWIPDTSESAKLKVRFFWPFSGNYWILELDDDYQHVLVGDPSRKYLWVLCRQKTLDDSVYKQLTEKASQLGFDTGNLERVNQTCP
jgi:lipocalin